MEKPASTNWLAFGLIAGFIVLVLLLLGYLFFFQNKVNTGSSPTTTSTKITEAAQVSITKTGFVPAEVKVKKGTSVTWTNNDSLVHRVAADPYPTHTSLPALDSGALSPNDTFTFTFEKTGKFTYHDENNPLKNLGTVVVE